MNNLNSILIEGNLVKDPLLRSTPKGTQVCMLRIASNRFYDGGNGMEKEVSFFDIETWSKLAEACYAKAKKGRGVRVVGRLKQDIWNGPDGKPQSRISVVAEHVEFRPEFKKSGQAEKITYEDDLVRDYVEAEEAVEALMEGESVEEPALAS